MKRRPFDTWPCSIARTSDLLGDAWTLLVLRDAFYGETRFDGFVRSLGIARNTLSDRLRLLTDANLLERAVYQTEPTRHEYLLTVKGADFFGVLAAFNEWGDRWLSEDGNVPVVIRHETCGNDVHAEVVCKSCGQEIRHQEVTARPGPGYPSSLLGKTQAMSRFALQLGSDASNAGDHNAHSQGEGR